MKHTVTELLNSIKESIAAASKKVINDNPSGMGLFAKMYADSLGCDLADWKYDYETGNLDVWMTPRKPIEYITINFTAVKPGTSFEEVVSAPKCPDCSSGLLVDYIPGDTLYSCSNEDCGWLGDSMPVAAQQDL